MASEVPRYRYRVDADDLFLWVDVLWLAFAQENGAPQLIEQSVIGRSLWDFGTGDVIRRLYEAIHARVRASGEAAVLPFRCDSPALQRHVRLTINAWLTLCSCCKRALLEPQGWLDVEDVTVGLRLFETQEVPQLRHDIRPDCARALARRDGQWRRCLTKEERVTAE